MGQRPTQAVVAQASAGFEILLADLGCSLLDLLIGPAIVVVKRRDDRKHLQGVLLNLNVG